LLASLALLAFKWPFSPGGPTVAAAQRILAGEIPYRDFWTLYAPGSFYLHALLLKIFGEHLLTDVIAGSLLTAVAVSCAFLLVYDWIRQTGPALAVAALLFAVNFAEPYYMALGPYPEALLLILLTLLAINRYYSGGGLRVLFVAGLLAGVLIVFKHDVAGYTGLSIAAGLAVWHMLDVSIPWLARLRALVMAFAVFCAGACVVTVPVGAWFAVQAGADMWQDLILFPLTDFRYARPEHYPELLPSGLLHPWIVRTVFNIGDYLMFLLPTLFALLAPLLILVTLLRRYRRHAALGVTFLGAWLFHYASAHVQINTNIISMTLYAALLSVLLYFLLQQAFGPGRLLALRVLSLLFVAGWCAALTMQPAYRTWMSWQEKTHVQTWFPRAYGMRMGPREYQELGFLAGYLREHADGNDYLYIGLQRHDVTVNNHCELYFVLDKLNPTRHDQLHPGIAERADYQRQIIRDLEARQVSTLFLFHFYGDEKLDRILEQRLQHLPQSGSTVLDSWIRQHYHLVDSYDRWQIWVRNATEPP